MIIVINKIIVKRDDHALRSTRHKTAATRAAPPGSGRLYRGGQAVNDRQLVEPMLARLQSLPEGLNQPEQVLADTGYLRSN
jgi:hypothetical protein